MLRTAAFFVVISASACTAASDKPRVVAPRTHASSVAPQMRVTAPADLPGSIRSSFQDCVDKAAGATWPTQDCIADEYDYQDARLNRAYGQLLRALPRQRAVNPHKKQRSWIAERDTACPRDANTEGQSKRPEANYCAIERTANGAGELEMQLRESGENRAGGEPSPARTNDFLEYSKQNIAGTALKCIVGATTDEDGMDQKPVVRLADADGKLLWTKAFAVPNDYYQGRATHCLSSGNSLFALLQFDTQPARTLSQTQVRVARLRLDDGALQKFGEMDIPGVSAAYSAWVSGATSDFSLDAGKLIIIGKYFVLGDEDNQRAFRVVVDPDSLQ